MATAISRDVLNKETNARFWAQTKYKVGKPLDPKNPLDKVKIPVWNDTFRKVQAEANAGKLVITYDKPEVAQALADAQLASTVAEAHVDAAVTADPVTAQQHVVAAATAKQVASIKTNEAAANQPPTVSPQLVADAKREAAKTPPPPHAPAADQIAHAQLQNGMLRPEDDPWSPQYVPKATPQPPARPAGPRTPPPVAQPSKSPRERPSREVINNETNARFWVRTKYKPHQKLDMAIAEDRAKAEIWKQILREVEREANAGRLTLTDPELIPPPSAAPRPPAPPPALPRPPAPRPPPRPPAPPPMQPQPPMGPGPSPGPMGPGPSPGSMGPGPSPGPMGPGPSPGPMGPGPMGPRPGPIYPGPMGPGPLYPGGPMGPGQIGPRPGPRPGPWQGRPPIDSGPGPQPGGPGPGEPPPGAPGAPGGPSPETPIDASPGGQPGGAPTGETAPAQTTDTSKDEGPTTEGAPTEQPKSSTGKWVALSVVGLLLVGGAGYAISRSRKTPVRTRSRAPRDEADATIRSSMRDAAGVPFPSGRGRM